MTSGIIMDDHSIENQRGFKTTAHRGGRQRQILLRILFQGKD